MRIHLTDKLIGLFVAFALHAGAALAFLDYSPIDGAIAAGDGGISIGLGMAGAYTDAAEQTVDSPEPVEEIATVTPSSKNQTRPQPKKKSVEQPDIIDQQKPLKPELSQRQETSETTPPLESISEPQKTTGSKEKTNKTETEQFEYDVSKAMKKASGQTNSHSNGGRAGDTQGYFSQLMSWLNQHKNYPAELKKNKRQGTVIIKFTMNHDGKVIRSNIKKTSGITALDNAALNMLSSASPLPPIPDEMNRQQLTLAIPVHYSLRTK